MKKLFWFLMICFLCVSCYFIYKFNYKEVDNEELLNGIIKNETMFLYNSNLIKLSEYKIQDKYIDYSEYIKIDLDNDSIKELVLNTTSDYGVYLIFHIDGENIYSYEINNRSFIDLKTDGSFSGSNGASSMEYLTLRFNKSELVIKEECISDDMSGKYEINNKTVSKNEVIAFINNWNKKDNALFKTK